MRIIWWSPTVFNANFNDSYFVGNNPLLIGASAGRAQGGGGRGIARSPVSRRLTFLTLPFK